MHVPRRQPVRLGTHGGVSIFDSAAGLHDAVTGIAVIGAAADPEVIFEEHGVGETCVYLEAHRDTELNPALGPFDVLPPEHRAELAGRTQSADNRIKFQAIAAAFALEDASLVNDMLASIRESVAETGGSLWIVRNLHRYQRRRGMIRVLHAAQAQPSRSLDQLVGEPQPLEEHAAGSDSFVQHFYEPAMLLTSPFAAGIIASRAVPEASETYVLLVAVGSGHGVPLAEEDAGSWSDVFGGSEMYRDHKQANASWVRDVNFTFAAVSFDVLVPWWTDRLNSLLTEATDLGRYRLPDGLFNARGAYREARTLDRVFHTCTRIQLHPRDHVVRVAAAFELFDLLPELVPATPGARDAWRALLDEQRSRTILVQAFQAAPEPLRSAFNEKIDTVWGLLRTETLETVVPGRLADGGVLVGTEQAEMSVADYMGRLFQALRDTHHGYELSAQWKRDVLDTHTGHISVALPELALLYVFALLSDAPSALNGDWYRDGV